MSNPLLETWTTPFEVPPFDQIEDAHFEPAFELALQTACEQVDTIAANPDTPTFANTIEALERSDTLLDKVAGVFFNLASSDANETRQALQRDLSPKLAEFQSRIMMNDALFQRVDMLHRNREGLTAEQVRVLDLYWRMFVRSGANLEGDKRAEFADVMKHLAQLGTQFAQNVLAEEREWTLELAEGDVSDLPEFLTSAMKAAAQDRGVGGYVLTLSPSVVEPFLSLSSRRDLREQVWKAHKARGANGNEADNRAIIAETLKLRQQRAQMLGYDDFASFKLETEMAKTPDAVRNLLEAVWEPARRRALSDADALSDLMSSDGINDEIRPWDWLYYAEKRRKAEHDLDEAELKPYLQLDNMIDAAFDCATRLFGLTFRRLDLPLYHSDARCWEVLKGDRHMGVFVGDYFARPSKRSGAWCSRFRAQSAMDAEVRPIVVNVCNFAKPPEGAPSLLSFDDARTLFHEFGHALHSLLSDVTYKFISGTSVARDFVELPSQLFEHWLSEPTVLGKFAKHADTGAAMPQDLLDRVLAAENADQGFATVTYVASAMVDLDFHVGAPPRDPMAAQQATLDRLDIPPMLAMRHAAPHFQHVFSGDGYSSGYYSYMWSEVMDADAFEAFREVGDAFDPAMAEKLEKHIYSSGGSREAEELYTAFRGSMPSVDALLKGRGLDAA